MRPLRAGQFAHRVSLESVTRAVTASGYADTWTAYATNVPAQIIPATPGATAHFAMATIQTPVTHYVSIRHRSDLSVQHRVKVGTRALYIVGVQNVDEANRQWVLACEERAA